MDDTINEFRIFFTLTPGGTVDGFNTQSTLDLFCVEVFICWVFCDSTRLCLLPLCLVAFVVSLFHQSWTVLITPQAKTRLGKVSSVAVWLTVGSEAPSESKQWRLYSEFTFAVTGLKGQKSPTSVSGHRLSLEINVCFCLITDTLMLRKKCFYVLVQIGLTLFLSWWR